MSMSYKYEKFKFSRFYEKKLKDDPMNEPELEKIYNYPVYLRDSKLYSDKGFVNIDKGSQGGSHWPVFYVKNNKSFHFDSFRGAPDKFLLNQLPKPIKSHNYKIQDINSNLFGSYCLYFFYLIGRKNYYDTILKMYFENLSSNNSNNLFSYLNILFIQV